MGKDREASSNPSAQSLLSRAIEYHSAAKELFESPRRTDGVWNHVIYQNLFHSTETSLKAYQRTTVGHFDRGHSLMRLFESAIKNGIYLDKAEKSDTEAALNLLVTGNEDNGYRYTMTGKEIPSLKWAIGVVGRLIERIQPAVSEATNRDQGSCRPHVQFSIQVSPQTLRSIVD